MKKTSWKKIYVAAAAIFINIIISAALIALAYLERGKMAYGGEWMIIVAITAFNIYFLFELSKAREIKK